MSRQVASFKKYSRLYLSCAFVLALIAASCDKENGVSHSTEPTVTFQIAIVSGNNQSGVVGSQLAAPFVVYVTDEAGMKQPSVGVTFRIVEGWGSLSGSAVLTDVDGYAEVLLTPEDPPGTVIVEASVSTGAAVQFTATGTAQ